MDNSGTIKLRKNEGDKIIHVLKTPEDVASLM
jgi:hypothetical protein